MSYIGFGLGNGTDLYLPIPKNASSAHRAMFRDARWQPVNFQNHTDLPCYIPWRNPLDRWFSGVAQYAAKWDHDYRQLIEQARVTGSYVLDKHTIPQSEYVLGTVTNRIYVRLEDAFAHCARQWGLQLPTVNRRRPDWDMSMIGKVETAYQTDMDIYESIPAL